MDQIKDPQLSQVSNLQVPDNSSYTYDSSTKTIIATSQSSWIVQELETGAQTRSQFQIIQIPAPVIESDKKTIRHHDRLRFIPANAESKMSVTHFGNILTSYSKKSQIAVANLGFSYGVHYWEIICPNKCVGIEVGIVKDWTEPSAINKKECIVTEFNTSTARTIALRLDLHKGQLEVWLKANESKKRVLDITKATWYPCVIIKELGNIAILNTYTTDSDQIDQTSNGKLAISHVKKALSQWIILQGKIDLKDNHFEATRLFIEQNASKIKIAKSLFNTNPKLIALNFNSQADLTAFTLDSIPSGANYTIIDSKTIVSWGHKYAKGQDPEVPQEELNKKTQEWVWKIFLDLIKVYHSEDQNETTTLITISKDLAEKISKLPEHSELSGQTGDLKIQYVKATDSLVVAKDNLLKLLNRVNGNFSTEQLLCFNRPCTPNEKITLLLDIKALGLLFSELDLSLIAKDISQQPAHAAALLDFYRAIESSASAKTVYNGKLIVSVVYKTAKRASELLIQILDNSYQWLKSVINNETAKASSLILKNIDENNLNILLGFVLQIDESLFAMVQHENASEKILKYWRTSKARMFSSLARIETLFSLPTSQYDIIKLADLGLFNAPYLYYEFRHFLNSQVVLDSENIIGAQTEDVASIISEALPNNRLLQSLPAGNVELSTILNNLPPQVMNDNIVKIVAHDELPYVMTFNEKGEVSLWNTQKALIYLGKSDFSQNHENKKPKLFKKKKAKSQTAAQPAVFGGGFGFGQTQPIIDSNNFQEPEEFDEENEEEGEKEPENQFGGPSTFGGGFGQPLGFGFGAPATTGGFGFGGGFGASTTTFGSSLTPATADKKDKKEDKKEEKKEDDKAEKKDEKQDEKKDEKKEEKIEKIQPTKKEGTFTFPAPSTTFKPSTSSFGFGFSAPLSQTQTLPTTTPFDNKKETPAEDKKETPAEDKKETPKKEEVKEATTNKNELETTATQEKSQAAEKTEEKDKTKPENFKPVDLKPISTGFGTSTGFGSSGGFLGSSTGGFGQSTTFGTTTFGQPNTGFGAASTSTFPLSGGKTITYDDYVEDWEDLPPEVFSDNPPGGLFGSAPKLGATIPIKPAKKEPINLEGSKMAGNVIIPIKSTPLCPAIIGVGFQKENELVLRLRRFGYSPSYIKKFFYEHQTEGVFSLLNSKFFETKNFDEIQNHLINEYGLVFSTLEPLFFGGNRYRKQETGSGKLLSTEWKVLEQFDCKIAVDQVIDIAALPIVEIDKDIEIRRVVVLGRKGGLPSLSLIKVENLNKNPYELDLSKEKSFKASLDTSKTYENITLNETGAKVFTTESAIIVWDAKSNGVHIFNNKVEFVKTFELNFEVKGVRALGVNILGFLDANGRIFTCSYEEPEINKIESLEIKKATSSSKDHLKEIIEHPLAHLDEITAALSNTLSGEKQGASYYFSVNKDQQSINVPLTELKQYSRVSLQLHFTRKAKEITTQNEENQIRKLLSEATSSTQGKEAQVEENDFPLFERVSNEPGALKYLPITVHSIKGGAFNQFLPATCMTTPSVEVFASKYPGAEFTFRHLHEKAILVDSLTISAPIKPSGLNAYPIASGLIYLADSVSALSELVVPRVNSEEEFKTWYRRRRGETSRLNENEPVGYFNLGKDKETDNFEITEKRPAKYILLKPITLRNEDKVLSANDYPVEIGFFGLHGLSLDGVLKRNRTQTKQHQGVQVQNLNIKVEVQTNDKWVEVGQVSSVNLTQFNGKLSAALIKQDAVFGKLPVNATSTLNFTHDALELGIVKNLRVNLAADKSSEWILCGVLAQAVVLSSEKALNLSYDSARLLREKLLSSSYEDILKTLSQGLCEEKYSLNDRKKIARILHLILSEKNILANNILKEISLEQYITLNIIPEIKDTSFDFLSLLRYLSIVEGFKKSLNTALNAILPKLADLPNLTNRGVKTYFTLLYWSNPTKDTLKAALAEIDKLNKRIASSRIHEYKLLRTQYNIPLLSFERELFDESFILQLGEDLPTQKLSTAEKPIKCRFLHTNAPEADEYIIDLQQTHDVSQVKLSFCEYDKLCKLRVQIWNISENKGVVSQKLLVSRLFNETEGVWLQLTKHAHEPSLVRYFTDSEQLSQLGFNIETRTRYLLVQVTYAFRSGLPSLNKDVALKKAIMPVIIGTATGVENDAIEAINKKFDVRNTVTFRNTVSVSSWLSYDRYDGVPDAPNTYLYEPSVKEGKEEDMGNEYDVAARIASLQGELYNQLYHQRNPSFFFQNHQKIVNLCASIQDAHIKLFNLTHDKERTTKEASPALPVLIYLVEAFSQYVIKVLGNTSTEPLFNSQGLTELFDNLLLLESPLYLQNLQKLFYTHSWNHLTADDRKAFLNGIFKKYLTSSVSIIEAPVDKLYPPLNVVRFLTEMVLDDFSNIKFLFEHLSEMTSLVGYTYALIIINEVYLSILHNTPKAQGINLEKVAEISKDVMGTLFRNVHYVIVTPEFSETEKFYLIGLLIDILLNVIEVIPPKGIDTLYLSSVEMFRIFHFIAKHNLNENAHKLIRILNTSSDILKEKYAAGDKDATRLKILLSHKDDPYCSFILDTIQSLVDFARQPEKKHHLIEKFASEVESEEWKNLLRLIMVHIHTLLESDRKEQLLELKKELKAKREKEEEELANQEEEKKEAEAEKKIEAKEETIKTEKEEKEDGKNEKNEKEEEKDKEEEEDDESEEEDEEKDKPPKAQPSESSKKPRKTEQKDFTETNVTLEKFALDEDTNSPNAVLSQLIVELVSLLSENGSKRKEYVISDSKEHWLLVLKILSMFKISEGLAIKIAPELLNSFLQSDHELQEYLYPFLNVTFKNLSVGSIDILPHFTQAFNHLLNSKANVRLENTIPLNLLLSSCFERARKHYKAKESKEAKEGKEEITEKPKVEFDLKLTVDILKLAQQVLKTIANFSMRGPASSFDELFVAKIQSAENLIALIDTSKLEEASPISMRHLIKNYSVHKDFLDSFIDSVIAWYLMNRQEGESANPPIKAFNNIVKKIKSIFDTFTENEEVLKVALKSLLENLSKVFDTISDLTCKKTIKGYASLGYSKRVCDAFEELTNCWLTSTSVVSYFTQNLGGFDYLLRILHLTSASQTPVPPYFEHNEISEYFAKRFTNLYSEDYFFKDLFQTAKRSIEAEVTEEEFANKVKIHRMKGQRWPKHLLDFSVNKATNAKVISFYIDSDEYCLCLEFERYFEFKSIIMGLLQMHEFGVENLAVMPDVYAEVGPSLHDLTYLGKLNQEGRMSTNSYVSLYSFALDKVSNAQCSSPIDTITSIPNLRVKFLKLRFRKPVIKFFEGFGFNETKPFKNLVVNIGFISVTGIDVSKYPNLQDLIVESTQQTAMRIIDNISTKSPEAWQELADQGFLLEKNQASLDAISNLIDINSSLITKILLSFSKYSDQIGTWLFEKLLESPRSTKYSGFIGELISHDHTRVFKRLDKLNKFLLKEAKALTLVKYPEKYANEFDSLLHFIDILTTGMHLIPESQTAKPIELDVTTEDIENLITLYHKFAKSSTSNVKITKLIICYIFPPKPFHVKESNFLKYAIDSGYKLYRQGSNISILDFLGPLSIGSTQASKWLISELEPIFNEILSTIKEKPASQLKSLKPYFTFLTTICRNAAIKEKIASNNWHIQLYITLRDNDSWATSIFKTTDPDILNYLLVFIKNVILGDSAKEDEFVKLLKEDLLLLGKQNDNSFLEHFFLPMIKSEPEVPVCLYPYDFSRKQWIGDIHSVSVSSQDINFHSKLLKPDQLKALNETLKRSSKRAGTFSKYCEMRWEKAFSSTVDGDQGIQQAISEKVSGKGPFMIILEGNTAGGFGFTGQPAAKKGIAGVFSGKPFPNIQIGQSNYFENLEKPSDAFLFYYDEKKKLHFMVNESRNKNFANVNLYSGGGGVSFYYHTTSPIYLSLYPGQYSYCSFDLLNIKPVEDIDDKFSILSLNQFSNIEIWVLREDASKRNIVVKPNSLVKESNILRKDWFNHSDPLNYYRPMPVYNIPSSINVGQISESFFKEKIDLILRPSQEKLKPESPLQQLYEFIIQDASNNGIVDIEFDYNRYTELKNSGVISPDLPKVKYVPNLTIFEAFKKQQGIESIIQVAISNIDKWKKKDLANKWKQWMTDLKNLSDFPNFFEAFIKNTESTELLFQILANKPDEEAQKSEEDAKKWEEKEEGSYKYIYQALADSFAMVPSAKACELAIESNKFKNILDIIGVISKEKSRKWCDNPEEEEEEKKDAAPQVSESPTKKPEAEEKKKGKKKGVGYGSDYVGGMFQPHNPNKKDDQWNVNKFVEKKKLKNEQIMSLINVLASIFETKDWEPPQNVLKMICESALLPLLEAAFRNGSLVDMGKESDLYFSYLRLVKAISTHKNLIPCLLELDRHYQPKQRDSVYQLLSHMNDISKIFINCLSNTDFKKEEEEDNEPNQPVPFGGGALFGTDPNTNNDVNNAWKILNKPLKHTKATFGLPQKEFIAQQAITTNNPDLFPQVNNQFGFGGSVFGATNVVQKPKEEKKVEKKPKPSVFTSKVTKEEKKTVSIEEKMELEKKEAKQAQKTAAKMEKMEKEMKTKISQKKKLTKKKVLAKKGNPKPAVNQAEKDEEALQNERLAHEIISVFEFVKKEVAIFKATEKSSVSIEEILKKPLPEAYRTLLGDLRFDYMDMKENGKYSHYYASYINNNAPPQAKMIRLAQELADLSNSLPTEHTNSIFVRVDKSKVDLMKVLIMGSAGTPYGHGAFEFDVYFDDTYPNAPPKVNLMTTGSGAVRFNPNLYANGKVCLSLLGTWSGKGGENWNPKLSTFLQVLLSIQSLIMSEDIYFNEPGLEVHAGTEQGELENEGYSNVVRYCNIKYAMLGQIRHPSKGFEAVIRRHFYLKKQEILEECKTWIKWAKTKNASYNGCQNYNWQRLFQQSKDKYHDMLVEIVNELKEELDKLPPPSEADLAEVQEHKKIAKVERTKRVEDVKQMEDIDVSYDKEIKTKELDITDEAVKDRWSRYIGAMGLEAVAKQANSSVFLSGLGALGVEIAKNIVLSGVKRFTIHDAQKATLNDLAGQFFIDKEDVGKNRATASLNKIQQLNYYVKVDTALLDEKLPTTEEGLEQASLGSYNIVILTEADDATIKAVNAFCRKRNIKLIVADTYGPFARIFNDFGNEFTVVDKNGEEAQEVMIKSITNEERGLVTLLETNRHHFEDGDEILITEVQGMETPDGKSINGTRHKIKVETAFSFRIGDTRGLTPYKINGKAKEIKNPVLLKFKSYEEASQLPNVAYDANLLTSDFCKLSHPVLSHIAFAVLDEFRTARGRLPNPWSVTDSDEFIRNAREHLKKLGKDEEVEKNFERFMRIFSFTCSGTFAPLAAFIGGFVSQEAVKAMTNKFVPIKQFFYNDCIEVVPDLPQEADKLVEALNTIDTSAKNDRYDGLRTVVGNALTEKLAKTKLFMIGVGAIGCELLKNFAMIGAGRDKDGHLTITDPDVIETSNLNRQFLFREKHLRKPKSQTAAAAVYLMNSDLKGHITARLDKVHAGTADIFTDKFFEELHVVANALDNVQARRYMDMRCVKAKTPLLESGTLGPKGHVQVILPYKTETYASQEDPQDDHEIPHCTLKMFPEETLHCVEWARDKFGKLFSQKPKSLAKLIEDPDFKPTNAQELQTFKEAIKLLKNRPTTFDDCIKYAREKFQKYFVNDIRQLLFTYPLDHKTKEGTPFWSSPKRPPTEIQFDPTNILHAQFIVACACLRAVIFGVPFPSDVWKDSVKLKLAQEAAKIKVKDFRPSAEKAKAIASEVDSEAKKLAQNANEEEKQAEDQPTDEFEAYTKQFRDLITFLDRDDKGKIRQVIFPEEFEKDNDKNFHIDFIHTLANNRAANYKLEPMDWMTVKIKAGRIVPALATTTASIAGLQTIELVKIMKGNKTEEMKNAFMNFAVPYLTLSEPGPAKVSKLTDKVSVTVWDRWEFHLGNKASLKDVFSKILENYELECKDVMFESQAVYFHNLMDMPGKEAEKEKTLNKDLRTLLDLDEDAKYADLTITFTRKGEKELLKETPQVRVYFD